MGIVERLTLEAAAEDSMLACEHRHRYLLAASLCTGLRVLDLCCGSGYGSVILAEHAASVLGVDRDVATIELAAHTIPEHHANVSFAAADAASYLAGDLAQAFDVVVCFEGLEHLTALDDVLTTLQRHTAQGLRLIASIPNGKLFREDNPFHITEFGYDEARAAFDRFDDVTMLPQFLAEGSVILPPHADAVDVTVSLQDRHEPEYANHFLFFVGFPEAEVAGAHHGRLQLNTSPVFNRWSEDLKQAARALRRENARLARAHLGSGGSAAAAALAAVSAARDELARVTAESEQRRARVTELEALLAARDGAAPERPLPSLPVVAMAPVEQGGTAIAGDPNTWEQRRRRAAECLVPWIEQTVPLAGRTVLEYGCGNGAVSSAVAAACGQLIGVDIDERSIAEARERIGSEHDSNVVLEHHALGAIADAVRARSQTIDVFLLYAVLEHMTVAERLAVLRLAREVVRPGGAIVVCETPNRLLAYDHHTAQLPYFHLLPDDLALEYHRASERTDFTGAIASAAEHGPDAALEAIVRWGRGVSFHEFEVVFGDLSRHVIGSSYDRLLAPERPFRIEEPPVARYLDRARPDLAPAWSRAWLDVILSPEPVTRRPLFVRPWTMSTTGGHEVDYTRWESLRLRGPASVIAVDLPHPVSRLVVGAIATGESPVQLRARARGGDVLLAADGRGPAGHPLWLEFALPVPSAQIDLAAQTPAEIVFIGFDD